MKINKNSLVLAAAFAGLLTGTASRVSAAPSSSDTSAKIGVAGQLADVNAKKVEKHACKGMNSCKGKGGCKESANGCKGKNSCKGKGGCATDGSKK